MVKKLVVFILIILCASIPANAMEDELTEKHPPKQLREPNNSNDWKTNFEFDVYFGHISLINIRYESKTTISRKRRKLKPERLQKIFTNKLQNIN